MALLRMSERFGQDPLRWCGRITPGWFELLLAYELVRRGEESP